MSLSKIFVIIGLWLVSIQPARAQFGTSDIKVFGYFQNSFIYQTDFLEAPSTTSFSVQQLNLFFQKDLGKNWRAFINFEFLNNFSSSRQWGAANLEEAWARYRANEKFSLKLGLLLPIFNHLNDIKNRTPLLPYVIRPLIYETSFSEFVATDEFTPSRAFIQAYGFLSIKRTKLDYAVYVGNSPNISRATGESPGEEQGQTGVDTTDTFLVGGRIGIRRGELKLGVSATLDHSNIIHGAERLLREPPDKFKEIRRLRFGGDLSYHISRFSFESEFILVRYDDDSENVTINKDFYYATLGYHITDQIFLYGSYWISTEDFTTAMENDESVIITQGEFKLKVPTVGASYRLNDRVTFKAQFAPVEQEIEKQIGVAFAPLPGDEKFKHYSVAASIIF